MLTRESGARARRRSDRGAAGARGRLLASRRTPVIGVALAAALLAVAAAVPINAQVQQVNRANWELAEKYGGSYLRPHIYSTSLSPEWINDTDSFWYSWRDRDGKQYWRVDPRARTKELLFDHEKMAAQLSEQVKQPYRSTNLPISSISFTNDGRSLRFTVEEIRLEYDLRTETLTTRGRASQEEIEEAERAAAAERLPEDPYAEELEREVRMWERLMAEDPDDEMLHLDEEGLDEPAPASSAQRRGGGGQQQQDFRNFSPDRQSYVYARNHNLYYVAIDDDEEQEPVQLTTDGAARYSFGAASGGGQGSGPDGLDEGQRGQRRGGQQTRETRVRPSVTWSRDSEYFYVSRNDSRRIRDLFLVNSLSDPRPTLRTYQYAMPGEEEVRTTELFVFHRNSGNDNGGVKFERLEHVDNHWKHQRLLNTSWARGEGKLRLMRRDRLQRNVEFIEVDVTNGAEVKVLVSDSVENSRVMPRNPRYVRTGGDFIWWSRRTGYGHFYLYDYDGELKNPITSGDFQAQDIVALDASQGRMWFTGHGREPEGNPSYRHLYRVDLDGRNLTLLTPGPADHNASLSPSRRYVVSRHSRVDSPPKAVVFDDQGRVRMELEEMDLGPLKEMGWQLPEVFEVKAADGITNIYGNMWKPFDFDPRKRYPVIAHVYPGPQTETVSLTFSATPGNQRLANLGFIVIQIGNRGGNPRRSAAYHSHGYYNLRDYGLADKKTGIEQLAAKYPWIDASRVGIYGHSGGGFMTAAALLVPPYNEFFTVGVSSAGNHDNNVYNQNWGESNHGLREVRVPRNSQSGSSSSGGSQDGQTRQQGRQGASDEDEEYDIRFEINIPANHEVAENLKGRLLLVHGDMDSNVHPAGTIRLVRALIRADKRFDFMLFPGMAHGFGNYSGYFTRMRDEYFAEHLLGDYYRRSAIIDR